MISKLSDFDILCLHNVSLAFWLRFALPCPTLPYHALHGTAFWQTWKSAMFGRGCVCRFWKGQRLPETRFRGGSSKRILIDKEYLLIRCMGYGAVILQGGQDPSLVVPIEKTKEQRAQDTNTRYTPKESKGGNGGVERSHQA